MANLEIEIIDNFNMVQDYFGFKLHKFKRYLNGKCPFHDGDNPTSISIYTEGNTQLGNWQCYTNGCHNKYGITAVGFIRACLSKKENRDVSIAEAIIWCEQFFKIKAEFKTKNLFDNVINAFNHQKEPHKVLLTTSQYNQHISHCDYFIKRNYKEETLNHFNVGYCDNPTKPFYERILVPHFNEDGSGIIGIAGRSVWEECSLCHGYHNPNGICVQKPKWRNTEGFPSNNSLYNIHRAKNFITKSKIAILVEGKPNVWRLTESGFPMGLACFGNKFSDGQKIVLDSLGVSTIIIVPDAGGPGENLIKDIKDKCKYSYNIVTIEPKYDDDIGKCNIETVKQLIGPMVEKYG